MSDAPKLMKTVRAINDKCDPRLAWATFPELVLCVSLLIGTYSASSESIGLVPWSKSRRERSSAEKERFTFL